MKILSEKESICRALANIELVKKLHSPMWDAERLICEGCEPYPFTPWPCSTAVIIYTNEEIAEFEEAERLYWLWNNDRR